MIESDFSDNFLAKAANLSEANVSFSEIEENFGLNPSKVKRCLLSSTDDMESDSMRAIPNFGLRPSKVRRCLLSSTDDMESDSPEERQPLARQNNLENDFGTEDNASDFSECATSGFTDSSNTPSDFSKGSGLISNIPLIQNSLVHFIK